MSDFALIMSKNKNNKLIEVNYLNKRFAVQNLKIGDKLSGDKRRNKGKKNLIDFKIKLNEDDWMFNRSVTTRDQRKSFKL